MIIAAINNGHDPSCALLVDGNLEVYIEEERLNRFKHGVALFEKKAVSSSPRSYFPFHSLSYCLSAASLGLDEVDRIIVTNRDQWIADRIPCKDKTKVEFLRDGSHHLCHALAAFISSPFGSSAVGRSEGCGTDRIVRGNAP
jgi:carbamoyltransferase